ncbi:sensor domain-containing diguanylate cyclase [Paenibacillus alginolyticus]|uniref:Diguanylate cyclase n=1 Tax=Paenibacillus alginolyticus TaxID=59839 RepID=A0ABT4GJQ3_9BACL|nr:diguanylate cyclase [Paenibacillus alginolyticus]MCY9696279.1 diguanylate cyclase [Paenibacillus alginolyticus]MEC0142554.1 diguanylate cyclase [Paenibacillus alginolyticus]
MSESLRSLIQQSRTEHFEEFLRQGLVLSSNFSYWESNGHHVVRDAFDEWIHQFGQAMLPPQTALLCVDTDLKVVNACSHDTPLTDSLLQVGASWNYAERNDNPLVRCAENPKMHIMTSEEMSAKELKSVLAASIPVLDPQGIPILYLGLFSHMITEADELAQLFYIISLAFQGSLQSVEDRRKYDHLFMQHLNRELEFKKHDILFEASKKLHAKIDVDSVLTEVIECMHSVYPNIQVDLLLSQDNDSTNLSVKPLNFQSAEDDILTRAFMEGQVIFEPSSESSGPSTGQIAAPLSGKQGVYGVLYMTSNNDLIHASDLQFISLLADTAGSAFENAKLYEQSNLMINELRLINDITKQLNQSLRLNEIFNSASSEILSIFGADYSCILQADKNSENLIVQATNLPAMFHETFTIGQGFSGAVYTSKEPIIISDYWSNDKVESKLMKLTNSRSLIGSPILVNGQVEGVILVVHSKPNFFSYDNYKLLQVLSGHIGLAMTNASLHAEVKRMVITDNLTGLYVRHYLDEQANSMQKKDFCGSLIVVDIDNFKRVNDTYGHQVGDKILIQVSQIIKTSIRDSDIAARWGGEELAVYLPQVVKSQTLRIAERIRIRVLEETNPQVTVSCGVSDWNWEEDKISVESLFYRADMALYQAKNNGRNQIRIG